MAAATDRQGQILSGIRVLDFGRYIAGPYCAALLGDLGAEVIRIEKRDGSEDRFVQPIVPGGEPGEGGEGAMFLQMNRNKRGLTLDPMTETGRSIVRRLVASADVVVANLPPSTLKAMGLDYESLTAIRPDIILTTVSAFGHGGPYSERTGFDGVAQSMVGAAYLTGHPDEPVKSYAPWVDFGTASLSAFGTLAALMERARSGRGQIVEGSLLSTALAYFNFHLIEQDLRKTNRIAIGNRSPYAGPADIVRTKDGWILVQVIGQPLYKRWVRLMGDEDGETRWLADPRFRTTYRAATTARSCRSGRRAGRRSARRRRRSRRSKRRASPQDPCSRRSRRSTIRISGRWAISIPCPSPACRAQRRSWRCRCACHARRASCAGARPCSVSIRMKS